jgi:hypothetical protein
MTINTVQEKKRVRRPEDPGSIQTAQARHAAESGKGESDTPKPSERHAHVEAPPTAKPRK